MHMVMDECIVGEISREALNIVKYLLVHDNNWCAFLQVASCPLLVSSCVHQ